MTQLPYMPLYVDPLVADTDHMSAENFGAYMLLLCAMWRRGGWVPDNNSDLARICRVDPRRWSRVRAVLDPLLIQEDGKLSQKRLLTVISDAQKRASLAALAASSRWHGKPKKNNGMADAGAYAGAMPPARATLEINKKTGAPGLQNGPRAGLSPTSTVSATAPAKESGDNIPRRRTNDWDMPAAPGSGRPTKFQQQQAAFEAGDETALDPLPGAPEKPKKETRQ
jgi:uncharacterized protein YdaU (DUF1376 family)